MTLGKIKILVISEDNVFADHVFWHSGGNSWFHRLFVFVAPKCPSEAKRNTCLMKVHLGVVLTFKYWYRLPLMHAQLCLSLSVSVCLSVSLRT